MSVPSPRQPLLRLRLVAALLLALVAAACGSRIPTDEHLAAGGDARTVSGSRVGDTAPDSEGPRRASGSPVPGVGEAGKPTSGTSGSGTGSAGSAAAQAEGGAGGGGAEGQPAAGGGDGTPIVIGSVGNYSGAPGTAQAPGPRAVQVWVNAVNRSGGVAGHPIEYIVVDDGSDPARHRAAVQELVENKGVIAFVGQFATQTDTAARSYLEQKGIPVVGGTGESFHGSPVFFPNFAPTEIVAFGAMQNGKRFTGKSKLATLTCVEADVCAKYKTGARQYAADAGMSIVYQADISVAQPDFTAECIQARSSGADIIMPVGDQNTVRRVVESCSRQNFEAALINVIPDDTQVGNPLFEGSAVGTQYFPFTGVAGDNPTAQYVAAFEEFAPQEPLNTITAAGWAAAKIFEAAVVGGIGDGAPSSEKLLAGLRAMDGETLGGLVVPLRFASDPPTTAPCWFSLHLTGGSWTAPDGLTPRCRG